MLKFAIIGPLTENTKDLIESIQKAGHCCEVFRFSDITFETDEENKFKAICNDSDVCDFDIVLFRGYNEHIYEAKLLARMLVEKRRTIIEQTLTGDYVRGKVEQAKRLVQSEIKHPRTFQATSSDGWNAILARMTFPIIAKPVMGRKGRGIKKLNTIEDAKKFFSGNKTDYLAQQYFPIVSDFRVFVVGGEVIGGFQRFINEGEYKSNIHGTRAEKIVVSERMKNAAIDSTSAMGYEIAGVDLFENKEEVYVIEVNVSPQWEKFKLLTGINPAENIISYAIRKHAENSK